MLVCFCPPKNLTKFSKGSGFLGRVSYFGEPGKGASLCRRLFFIFVTAASYIAILYFAHKITKDATTCCYSAPPSLDAKGKDRVKKAKAVPKNRISGETRNTFLTAACRMRLISLAQASFGYYSRSPSTLYSVFFVIFGYFSSSRARKRFCDTPLSLREPPRLSQFDSLIAYDWFRAVV